MFGNKREEEKRFIKKSDDHVGLVTLYTVVDVKTGVNYLITLGPNGVSTTPMYDGAGDFFVDEEY
ncbi:DUF6440 family protein [Microaceticoccus formicicus]|uniref:DUF6440 family protein n=1 Tax=Microaceticoccus formicicus TaxID=3118105 RepID=UPI003CD02888|nr:DUF6440 family protein [Peptoniphilaceae bacterium AMB_02]